MAGSQATLSGRMGWYNMKTFKASKFQHHPGEIFDAAREQPVVVQRCKTNGDVIEEFVLMPLSKLRDMECEYNTDRFPGLSEIINNES